MFCHRQRAIIITKITSLANVQVILLVAFLRYFCCTLLLGAIILSIILLHIAQWCLSSWQRSKCCTELFVSCTVLVPCLDCYDKGVQQGTSCPLVVCICFISHPRRNSYFCATKSDWLHSSRLLLCSVASYWSVRSYYDIAVSEYCVYFRHWPDHTCSTTISPTHYLVSHCKRGPEYFSFCINLTLEWPAGC